MPVKGSLDSVGLEDLLQAKLAAQGAGRLTLRQGAQYAALYLDADGLYVVQPDLMLPDMLLDAFVARGLLDPDVLKRERRGQPSSLARLDALVADGDVPEADFLEVLATEVEDTVLDMMLWDDGWFRFEVEPKDAVHLGLLGRICVDTEGVTARALERIEERRLIGDVLGDHALLFVSETGDLPPLEHEKDPLHAVYALLNGTAIVHEIALRLGRGRFEVLKAIARLASSGLARVATDDELMLEASERTQAGQHVLARRLILQWAETRPDDPAPLRKLARLAKRAGDLADQIEALCALGHLHLRLHETAEALDVFSEAMHLAPADDVVLAGLRIAAEAAGDNDAIVESTLLTAQTKLDEEQPLEALALLEALQATHPTNMAAHLLRARALVQSEKRAEFFEHAEAVGRVLASGGCRSKADREAAEFFRDTITELAPDRGDLIERFRTIYDPRKSQRRTLALVVALVLLVAGAGVYYWPASAASLLADAQEAAGAGDRPQALALIGQLAERFPDTAEAEEAFRLQTRLTSPRPASTRKQRTQPALKAAIEEQLPPLRKALADLPRPEAQAHIRETLDLLAKAAGKRLRGPILRQLATPLCAATKRLDAATLERVQVLGRTAEVAQLLRHEPDAVRTFLHQAERAREADWITQAEASSTLLYQLARLDGDGAFRQAAKAFVRSTDGLHKAVTFYDKYIDSIRLSLASMEIEKADRCCREDASALMVSGHLDEADAIYARMEALLATYGDNATYAHLIDEIKRRQLPQLIRKRRAQVKDIRERIGRAKTAEAKEDFAAAVAIYAALVKEYWLIRFDSVFTLPLRVETVPSGALVTVGGHEVGGTPVTVRYAWGSEVAMTLRAPGYAAVERMLRTAEEHPASRLAIALEPAPRWIHAMDHGVTSAPFPVGEHVLLVERNGTLTLLDGQDGHVRWSAPSTSLEGVRGRPALAGGRIYVPYIDGHVVIVDAATGTLLDGLTLQRLDGNAAAQGEQVALLTQAGTLVLLEKGTKTRRIDLEAAPSAGVLAAHGAYWIGTLDGTLLRVDPTTGKKHLFPVAKKQAPLLALSGDEDGLYVTTSSGALVALAPDGSERWRRVGVGDMIGAPARAGPRVGVVLRSGQVRLFAAEDGAPGPVLESGSRPLTGVIADGSTLFLVRANGRAWACETAHGRVVLDAGAAFPARCGPAVLSGGRIALPWAKGRVAVIAVPRAP